MQRTVTLPPNADEEGGDEEIRSPWEELGIPEPDYLDERRAPPVDRELIRQLVRRELPQARASEVTEYILLFKSWNDAHEEVMQDERKRRREERH